MKSGKFIPYEPEPEYDKRTSKEKALQDTLALYQKPAQLRSDRTWLIFDSRVWLKDGGAKRYRWVKMRGTPANYEDGKRYFVPASCVELPYWWSPEEWTRNYALKERPTGEEEE